MNSHIFIAGAAIIMMLIFSVSTNSQPYKQEKKYIEHLIQNAQDADFIEGIWKVKQRMMGGIKDKRGKVATLIMNIQTEYRIAIIKVSDRYFVYKCDEYFHERIFQPQEDQCLSFSFERTAKRGQYIFELSGCETFKDANGKAFINAEGDLVFEYIQEKRIDGGTFFDFFNVTAVKVAPTQEEILHGKDQKDGRHKSENKQQFSFGTCFAISDNLLLTSYHVVKDAKSIQIRGLDGNFDTTYSAKLIYFDEAHDIACLNILGTNFDGKIGVPYSIKQKISEVGESVFVLGYPLHHTMGQEIKLTTGILSSNSGFMGDTTLFQISAPLQPGNSGGPLFDENGILIGIIAAKHKNADNVGYAVKINFVESFLTERKLDLSKKQAVPSELSKKVKLFKDYIYSVEVELQ